MGIILTLLVIQWVVMVYLYSIVHYKHKHMERSMVIKATKKKGGENSMLPNPKYEKMLEKFSEDEKKMLLIKALENLYSIEREYDEAEMDTEDILRYVIVEYEKNK